MDFTKIKNFALQKIGLKWKDKAQMGESIHKTVIW